MNNLVTTIVLTYNKFDYLFDAIDSILKQDYPAVEIIISDDCSTNFPKQDICRYIDEHKRDNIKKVVVLHHSHNLGTVRNYNAALSYASGKYLIDVSGDDKFYDETVIRRIVNRFEETNAEVIVCSRQYMTENGKDLYVSPTKFELSNILNMRTHWDQYKAIITGHFYRFASGSAMYFKREMLVQRGGYDESYVLWEDGPFVAQYCYEKIIQYAYDIVSIRYRMGGVSTSNVVHPLLLADMKYFQQNEVIKHLEELDWYTREQIRYIRAMGKHRLIVVKLLYKLRFLHIWIGNRWYQVRNLLFNRV